MITSYTPLQLARIMGGLYPSGQWAVRDSEIVDIPPGETMPTAKALADEHARQTAKQAAETTAENTRATAKATLFATLKTRLLDLGLDIATPADLDGKIDQLLPAVKARRESKTTTPTRLAELESQVELLTLFVVMLSRK